MGRVFFMALLGALAGLLAWAVTAPLAPMRPSVTVIPGDSASIDNSRGIPPVDLPRLGQPMSEAEERRLIDAEMGYEARWAVYEGWFIYALGAFIGLAMGVGYGMFQGSRAHALRGGAIGLLMGIVGAKLGYAIGGGLVTMLLGSTSALASPSTALPVKMFGRTLVGAPIGAFLGLVMGIPAKSLKQAALGLAGGAIGGAIGGFVFDPISSIIANLTVTPTQNTEIGGPGRLILSVVMGLAIGLFTSLIQVATRTAWVRRIYGRNEYKEYIVDAPQTTIGRNETCHIYIGGDPGVAPVHCVIQRHQGNYLLADCQTGLPTLLNGQPIRQVPLFSGAIIQVGSTQLEFVLKQGSAPQRAAEQFRSQQFLGGGPPSAPAGVHGYGQPTAGPAPFQPQQAAPFPQQAAGAAPMPSGMPTVMQGSFYARPGGAGPAPMMPASFCLVAQNGPLAGQRYPISVALELGRDCPAIPLSWDNMVSRRHLQIMPSPSGIAVNDLGSTNGTFVNDQRVASSTLRQGDLLRIGATTFRVEPL